MTGTGRPNFNDLIAQAIQEGGAPKRKLDLRHPDRPSYDSELQQAVAALLARETDQEIARHAGRTIGAVYEQLALTDMPSEWAAHIALRWFERTTGGQ